MYHEIVKHQTKQNKTHSNKYYNLLKLNGEECLNKLTQMWTEVWLSVEIVEQLWIDQLLQIRRDSTKRRAKSISQQHAAAMCYLLRVSCIRTNDTSNFFGKMKINLIGNGQHLRICVPRDIVMKIANALDDRIFWTSWIDDWVRLAIIVE